MTLRTPRSSLHLRNLTKNFNQSPLCSKFSRNNNSLILPHSSQPLDSFIPAEVEEEVLLPHLTSQCQSKSSIIRQPTRTQQPAVISNTNLDSKILCRMPAMVHISRRDKVMQRKIKEVGTMGRSRMKKKGKAMIDRCKY